jgi:hypothetical protein
MSLIYGIALFAFFHFLLLVPGYATIRKAGILKKSPGLEVCFAYVLGIVVPALIGLAGYVLRASWESLFFISWLWVIIGSVFFFKNRLYKFLTAYSAGFVGIILLSLASVCFIFLTYAGPSKYIPDPQPKASSNYSSFVVKVLNVSQTQANDNSVPYRQAQFFLNRSDPGRDSFIDEWGVHFFQRTPLMGAATAGYLNMLGDKVPIAYIWDVTSTDPGDTYIKFQVLAIILNSLFIFPAFILITKLFDKKTAIITNTFVFTSPFFIYNAFYSWPKSLAAFFILLMWLLLFEKGRKNALLAGAAVGLAYLSHDLALLYLVPAGLYLLYKRRWQDIFAFGGVGLLFMAPWVLTSSVVYSKPSTFIYYPFSVDGIPQISQKSEVFQKFLSAGPIAILGIKVQNLLYLLSPYQLFTSEGGQDVGRRLWALSLFSVPGATGLGLMLTSFLGFLRAWRKLEIWLIAIFPIVLSTIVIGWPKGLGALHFAQPAVLVMMALSVVFLIKLKNTAWVVAAYAINLGQLIFFLLYSYGFTIDDWSNSLASSVLLFVLFLVAIYGGVLINGGDTVKKA